MCNKNLKILGCMVLVTGALSGLAGCGCTPSKPIQTEEKQLPLTLMILQQNAMQMGRVKKGTSMQRNRIREGILKARQEMIPVRAEMEIVNAAEFGNPKEVLDHMPIVSNVTVIKTGEDELQIEFELENVGLCTFAAGKGEKFVLPDEVLWIPPKLNGRHPPQTGNIFFLI